MADLNIKILIVGDTSVGKTSLLLNYIENSFPDTHLATVGVEYRIKSFEKDGFKIKLQIWDTAGQERFRSITNNFFRNADGIIFVFDISNYKSFEGVKGWVKESEIVGDDFKRILIGNKCDLKHERNVPQKEIDSFIKENNLFYIEASAKESINIKQSFNKIVDLMFEGKTKEEILEEYGLKTHSLSVVSKSSASKRRNSNARCCS